MELILVYISICPWYTSTQIHCPCGSAAWHHLQSVHTNGLLTDTMANLGNTRVLALEPCTYIFLFLFYICLYISRVSILSADFHILLHLFILYIHISFVFFFVQRFYTCYNHIYHIYISYVNIYTYIYIYIYTYMFFIYKYLFISYICIICFE